MEPWHQAVTNSQLQTMNAFPAREFHFPSQVVPEACLVFQFILPKDCLNILDSEKRSVRGGWPEVGISVKKNSRPTVKNFPLLIQEQTCLPIMLAHQECNSPKFLVLISLAELMTLLETAIKCLSRLQNRGDLAYSHVIG